MRLAALITGLMLFSLGRSLLRVRADLMIHISSPPLRLVWRTWVDQLLRRDPDPDPDPDDESGEDYEGEDGDDPDELPPVRPSAPRQTRVEAWVTAQLPLLDRGQITYGEIVRQGTEILQVSAPTIKRAITRARRQRAATS